MLFMPPNSQRLKHNNFDLLRFLFAVMVCLIHTYEVSGQKELAWLTTICSSKLAVESFFIISGFLIFMSYEKSTSLGSYFSKRLRRIYPAYFIIILLSAVLLSQVSELPAHDYFSSAWLKYLATNLTFLNFLHPTLPGVFPHNAMPAINGSLWTLKIEVIFYAAAPCIVYLFNRFGRLPVAFTLYILSALFLCITTSQAAINGSTFWLLLSHQFPAQLMYFISGALLYYYLPLFERRLPYFLIASLGIFVAHFFYPLSFLEPLTLAVLVVFLGLYGYLGNFAKYGDFSYGFYLIHFPIIQLLVYLQCFQRAPLASLLAVCGMSLVGAVVMWHGVEKRFLSKTTHRQSSRFSDSAFVPPAKARPNKLRERFRGLRHIDA
jgi:peptidoglycan/LPS O-acetylase OafA/YrhL